jgi:uncharacterized coiled-coil DUF342 family protein
MKKVMLILLCLSLSGCAGFSRARKLNEEVNMLQEFICKKDEEIKTLQASLEEKDRKIKELKEKLEGLGVFN